MQILLQDLRYGIRRLLKSPGFTAVAVLSLALGIGANTVLFSLVDAVLLKTLPVKKPEELALFKWASGGRGLALSHNGTIDREPGTGRSLGTSFSVPAFEQMRAHAQTLSDLFAFAPQGELNVGVDGQAEAASGQLVSGNFHSGLGVRPALGRMINDDDDRASANPVAVISHRYWRRRFGLDPAVVGKTININGAPFTIVGVTPPQFYSGMEVGDSPDLTVALALAPRLEADSQSRSELAQAWYWWLRIMGRVKPGISLEQARAELEGVFQQSALAGWEASPANRRPPDSGPRELPRLRALPGGHGEVYLRQSYAQPLRVMLIVVALTLLVACANIANLLLARAVTRRQEMAVRLALGVAVREADKDLPLFGVKTQIDQMDQSLAQERFFPKLTSFFGLLALLLAGIGLYGVMSYAVAQRAHEIGIRMALGATRENILRRVVGQGMLLAGVGVAIGSATAFALGRLITSDATYELTRFISDFLYGVRATDPLTFVTVASLLLLVALLACYLPARRATRVDPMVALRCE